MPSSISNRQTYSTAVQRLILAINHSPIILLVILHGLWAVRPGVLSPLADGGFATLPMFEELVTGIIAIQDQSIWKLGELWENVVKLREKYPDAEGQVDDLISKWRVFQSIWDWGGQFSQHVHIRTSTLSCFFLNLCITTALNLVSGSLPHLRLILPPTLILGKSFHFNVWTRRQSAFLYVDKMITGRITEGMRYITRGDLEAGTLFGGVGVEGIDDIISLAAAESPAEYLARRKRDKRVQRRLRAPALMQPLEEARFKKLRSGLLVPVNAAARAELAAQAGGPHVDGDGQPLVAAGVFEADVEVPADKINELVHANPAAPIFLHNIGPEPAHNLHGDALDIDLDVQAHEAQAIQANVQAYIEIVEEDGGVVPAEIQAVAAGEGLGRLGRWQKKKAQGAI